MIDAEVSSSNDFTSNKTNQQPRNLEFIEKANIVKIREKWAVIIGISKYQDSSLNLKYADRDAQEFYNLLIQPKEGFFKEDHIEKLINEEASQRRINRALKSFLQKPSKDDLVLIYFACHGTYDPNRPQVSYILSHDTEPDDIASSAVPMREIESSIRDNLNAKKVVIIADACHSAAIGGEFGRRDINSTAMVNNYLNRLAESMDGTALITSAEAREVALEDDRWGGGHGVFTHYLIEGMKGEADGYGGGDKDGVISIGELFEYVRVKVQEATDYKQHPFVGTSPYDRNLPLTYVESIKEQEFVATPLASPSMDNSIIDEGLEHKSNGEYNLALECFNKAIIINPNNYVAHKNKGDILFKKGDLDGAINAYDKAISAKPERDIPYRLKGVIYSKLEKYKEAIECYDKALKINSRYIDALMDKGLALYKLQQYNEAISCYEDVLAIDSENKGAKHNRVLAKDSLRKSAGKKAIVIGINKYQSLPGNMNLQGAENDANELYNILKRNGFTIENSDFLLGDNATHLSISKSIDDAYRKWNAYGTILFYFSGLSFVDENKDVYIAPYDILPDNPHVNGISIEELNRAIDNSTNNSKFVTILDCCYHGGRMLGEKRNRPETSEVATLDDSSKNSRVFLLTVMKITLFLRVR